jgi:hypothetical protein
VDLESQKQAEGLNIRSPKHLPDPESNQVSV